MNEVKSYIRIDVRRNLHTSLSFEDDGSNDIYVTVTNGDIYGVVYVLYGSVKKELHLIPDDTPAIVIKINPQLFSGKGLIHIQYTDGQTKETIHILGCEEYPEDMYLVKKTERILSCVESANKEEAVDKLDTIVVKSLPEVKQAKNGVIYRVPKVSSDAMDMYDEYQLVKGKWERFGPKEEQEDIDFEKILPEE